MIYGFDTDEEDAATAALMLYAVYRSRDRRRHKVTPDMWGQIERFAKASAKRATNIPQWIEGFKPRVSCDTINPRWMRTGIQGRIELTPITDADGMVTAYVQPAPVDLREFLTPVLKKVDQRKVVDRLYSETAYIVLLVRDRLEREKPIENQFNIIEEEAAA
jgi:hypothetical protein